MKLELTCAIWFGLFVCFVAYQAFWLYNAKSIFLEEQLWYSLTHIWEDKGVLFQVESY